MKTLFILLILGLVPIKAQNLKDENKLIRTKLEHSGNTYYVYELGENSIFSILDHKTKKEEVLNFCSLSLYLEFLAKDKKDKEEIFYKQASESISNSELFKNFLNLEKDTLVITTIY